MNFNVDNSGTKHIAYFSMEIGITTSIPTYSGGLGVLAGDTLKSAADLGMPVAAMTLLHREGYFKQTIDAEGRQQEASVKWDPKKELVATSKMVVVTVGGRKVKVKAWRYDLKGTTGHIVPIFFLDTDVPGNQQCDRQLTHRLYGGDNEYRLAQEIILGMGGVAMLEALGYRTIPGKQVKEVATYHMNEGHAGLLTVSLLKLKMGKRPLKQVAAADVQWVKERCIFTTHTPVPAGHDAFDIKLASSLLPPDVLDGLKKLKILTPKGLNMTHLALGFSRYVNAVAMRHGEVSRKMFPKYQIKSVTNGIHAATWTSDAFRKLFDKEIPDWRRDNFTFRDLWELDLVKIQKAHLESKKALLADVKKRSGVSLDPKVFTIGFARRAATYKRADLLVSDVERLVKIAKKFGGIQILYAGKAHPKDEGGKELIENVIKASERLAGGGVKLVYLENYDMDLGRLITTGVDLWLNNPVKPLEASGTSGMKAALNGVPNLSTLDGWWVEGHIENVTGWEIEDIEDGMSSKPVDLKKIRKATAKSLYDKLEKTILPLYYNNPDGYAKVMRQSIVINGSYFNTHRMVLQYAEQAYSLPKKSK